MNKLTLPATLIVGFALGFLVRPIFQSKEGPERVAAKNQAADRGGAKPTPATGDSGEAKQPAPTALIASDTPKKNGSISFSAIGPDGKKVDFDLADIQKRMAERQTLRDAKTVDLQLASLTAKLGLSPEQAEQVRKLLEARAQQKRDRFKGIFDLAGKGDDAGEGEAISTVSGLLEPQKDTFDADLAALLDDDQKVAYQAYLDEKRANEIEATASRDLANLQSMFPLSEEQKDRAFDAFASLAAESEEESTVADGGDFAVSLGNMEAKRKAKIEALEPILTPEQMDFYKDSAGTSGAMMHEFGGGVMIGTSVINLSTPATVVGEEIPIEDGE